MKLTKQHFVLIAETINSLNFPIAPEIHREAVARQFAKALKATNQSFDTDRFIEAAINRKCVK
jgi:hypothetical protein